MKGRDDSDMMCYGTILLVSNVIDYYERYQAGELRTAQLQTQLAQAELQALRMQLQPHFLFNTLNSISALQLTDVETANQMTETLINPIETPGCTRLGRIRINKAVFFDILDPIILTQNLRLFSSHFRSKSI